MNAAFPPGFTDAKLDAITGILKALAHELRLKLMRTLLENGERSVGELEALTGIGQPALSQQLAVLRKAELVQTRREAKLVFYSLAPETLQDTAGLLHALSGPPARDAATREDHARVRGSAATFARLV
ncbi:MAG: ArsR/SmtB family transcription factor [Sphingobium sp.]